MIEDIKPLFYALKRGREATMMAAWDMKNMPEELRQKIDEYKTLTGAMLDYMVAMR